MRKIILASSSPRRKELLERLGFPFTVEPGDYEEDMTLSLPPVELAETLATGKAKCVAIMHDDAIVIGADTFVEIDGTVLGKPHTAEAAVAMLQKLSGKTHQVHTGYCVIDTKTGETRSGTETAQITFREVSEREITAYVATGEPLDKAGAYAIQGGGQAFVSSIEGDYDAIVGLPLAKISEELRAFGA